MTAKHCKLNCRLSHLCGVCATEIHLRRVPLVFMVQEVCMVPKVCCDCVQHCEKAKSIEAER